MTGRECEGEQGRRGAREGRGSTGAHWSVEGSWRSSLPLCGPALPSFVRSCPLTPLLSSPTALLASLSPSRTAQAVPASSGRFEEQQLTLTRGQHRGDLFSDDTLWKTTAE